MYSTQGMHFSLQGMLFDRTVIVADLSVEGILALDFLRANKCSVYLNNCVLRFDKTGKPVACQYQDKTG